MWVKTAQEENWLEMQEGISYAAVILHCQQPHTETVNGISALEASEGPGPIPTENTSDCGGWETASSQPGLEPTRDMRMQRWDRTKQVPNLPRKPTILLSYPGTRNRTILPKTVKK